MSTAITSASSKLIIKAYKDPNFTDESTTVSSFETTIPPEKFNLGTKIVLRTAQPAGKTGTDGGFEKTTPQQLDLEFLFDRTGVIPGYPSIEGKKHLDVKDDIEAFKKVVLIYEGENHKPNYLMVLWGALAFKCMLSELNIEYKLFRPDGTVLRAVAKAKFIEFVEKEELAAIQNDQSPDLTHIRVVQEGDTLPLMTYRIYGDSKYYLQVAKVNGLANFRKLRAGQQIYFPPIQKQS
ncbi:MAG: hypothetical protein A3D31_07865 [Candidatus Fluviicola riflensis]|nr:MAG: hypothetical protein CHH17_07145 [Candidatus Fluviicola riflensis]OGS79859.1 MAG: hypothetical protein A3D31_07865 [Candidatus Fluviicola riflensis]OGS82374.1 MAG: hypothetical protein A2724_16810 [Fluviicola sp. RIFCSPHIGHO2_01_FULL_43_53]OGS88038.1 MAG: hypothetical protein A3E30_14245 [Fluviicola sp. RIFCSPHIGHO2_12_FULL_43_24]